MPTTYTQNNGLSKPGNGEGSGTWGTTANTVFDIIDRSISGVGAITLTGTTTTLATSDGVLSDGNYKVLVLGGSPSGANTITVTPSDAQKVYMVFNNTSESAVFTQGSGANVTITAGSSAMIYTDGGGSGAVVSDLTSQFRLSPVYDKLTAINALAVTDGNFIVGDGSTWGAKTPVQVLVALGVNSTAAELNILDGVTATAAELNILDGVTATAEELNILDGVTATAEELNYVDGVTSNIQTQLGAKAPVANATLTGITTAADIRLSAGAQGTPSVSFTGHTDTGMYFSGGYTTFTHDGAAAAFIDGNGTSVSSANAIITSEKGDARYLKLSGGAMTGDLDVSEQDLLNVTRIELLPGTVNTPAIYFSTDTDTGMYFSGSVTAFTNDGVEAAKIEPAGTAVNDSQSVITREKGDARYLELSGGTMTGSVNFGNQIITNINEIYASSGGPTDPSYTFTGHTDSGMYFDGARVSFTQDNVQSALIEPAGTSMPDNQSVVTRQKGDFRYSIKAPSAGSVGSYGMFKKSSSTSMSAGDTIAGSSLSYAGVSGGGTADSGTPTGTWRLMGHMGTSTSLVSVFVRIA